MKMMIGLYNDVHYNEMHRPMWCWISNEQWSDHVWWMMKNNNDQKILYDEYHVYWWLYTYL